MLLTVTLESVAKAEVQFTEPPAVPETASKYAYME
jgi:hypothetical protein